MNQLILYCRPGFENECAAEIQDHAGALDVYGYAKAKPGSAFVVFTAYEPAAARRLAGQLDFRSLIFARQLLISPGLLNDLSVSDRISPILRALDGMAERVSAVWIETADTNEAKALTPFCRSFAPPLRGALTQSGRLDENNPAFPRLHLLFLSSTAVYPALSLPGNTSPWFMGIPRLKLSRVAPSRSTLKLDEAIQHFLAPEQQTERFRPGMRAVDLGAAPGGWSWQLVRRHLSVVAVDNGPMNAELMASLMASGLIEHRREDGFRYRPAKPVDWMVCDMLEKPSRIARLVGEWLARGDCRASIFNLKLPMKKRYAEVLYCREIIAQMLSGRVYTLAFKQLYHDREEVTGYLEDSRTGSNGHQGFQC